MDTNTEAVEAQDPWNAFDEIVVIGSAMAGAPVATVLSPEELDRFARGDVLRALRAVPGVQLGEAEGFGLRPNIGIRGSGSERSGKVAIYEDGVPIAPAPYAAPAAYYFPTTTRIAAIEIAKGPAAIRYGPQTTAGAVHLFSTPIPDATSGSVRASYGTNDRRTVHGWAGYRTEIANGIEGAVMIEALRDQSDGFKDLPGAGDTGFELDDLVLKAGLYRGEASLTVKVQASEQNGDETYLGLTDADFADDPYARYAASALDSFTGDHETYQVTGEVPLGGGVWLTGLAYRTDFARSWYKLQEIETDDFLGLGGSSGTEDCDGLAEILAAPDACGSEFAVLRGADTPDDAVQIRDNNREYYAEGMQLALSGVAATGAVDHDLTVSIRLHQDGVDRFQDQDGYAFRDAQLVLTTDAADGTQANRLTKADAVSIYAEDRIDIGQLTLTAGLRYENVETRQRRWDTPDRALVPESIRENAYEVWLPALRADWHATEAVTLFAGYHEGFGVPSAGARDGQAETSVNLEAGVAYVSGDTSVVLTAYRTDYEDLLGRCTASSGSQDCDIGDAFNAGEAESHGVEALAKHRFEADGFSVPVTVSYAWTVSEFEQSFRSEFEPWGDVEVGDSLPYVPEHQLSVIAGVERGPLSAFAALSHVSDARATAGQGSIADEDLIEARTLLDLSARYQLTERFALRAFADNIFDEVYTASLRPAGRRPGKPRELRVGFEASF